MKLILLLEDEPYVMKLLRLILEPKYRVIEATTGEEGLRGFIDHNYQVDLLIADVTLPVLSGIEVALLLRSKQLELPVILTSGYPVCAWGDRDSAGLERLGSQLVTILEKPFQAPALLNAVREWTGPAKAELAFVI